MVRAAAITPLVNRMHFTCTKCGTTIVKNIEDGKFQPPTHCESKDCKSKVFQAIKAATCTTVDYQKIRVQEFEEDGYQMDPGRVPRTVDIEFTGELVDLVVPGDVICVTGIVKALNVESLSGRGSRAKGKGKESSLLLLLIEANAIENKLKCFYASNRKDQTQVSQSKPTQRGICTGRRMAKSAEEDENLKSDLVANLNKADYQMISTVYNKFDFAFLVHSLCPLIYGHEHVKAGLLLALSGGSGVHKETKTTIAVRPDIHILVVGDPGLGSWHA